MSISRSRWPIAAAAFFLFACDDVPREDQTMAPTVQPTAAQWQALERKRIIFGHQSVGQDILKGIQTVAGRANVDLPIVESRTPQAGPGITHFLVGENGDPSSKLNDFATSLENGLGQGADIAFVKLCYIDFNADSDAKQIAEQYSTTLARLSEEFPDTTFVAVTAPLTVAQTGPKAWIKRILGRIPSGYADNARRQEFNDILRSRYQPQHRLFDLAHIEAQGAPKYSYHGRSIEVLNPSLTYDDGHLNSQGGALVASELLKFLATRSD